MRWRTSLATQEAVFSLATEQVTVQLGFDWVGPSCYLLCIRVVTAPLQATAPTHHKPTQVPEGEQNGVATELCTVQINENAGGEGSIRT